MQLFLYPQYDACVINGSLNHVSTIHESIIRFFVRLGRFRMHITKIVSRMSE